MLTEKKNTISSNTIVNEQIIATHGALIKVDDGDISFYTKQLDKEACKEYRCVVREDTAEFEDYVYSLQEKLKLNN